MKRIVVRQKEAIKMQNLLKKALLKKKRKRKMKGRKILMIKKKKILVTLRRQKRKNHNHLMRKKMNLLKRRKRRESLLPTKAFNLRYRVINKSLCIFFSLYETDSVLCYFVTKLILRWMLVKLIRKMRDLLATKLVYFSYPRSCYHFGFLLPHAL